MSAERNTLYLKIDQHTVVRDRRVTIKDIAAMECTDEAIVRMVKQMPLYTFPEKMQKNQMEFFSVLKVIDIIHDKYPTLHIEFIGYQDFIVEFVEGPGTPKWINTVKLVLLCVVIFFGSAFTIMAFNNDVSVTEVFDLFYRQVMGTEKPSISELEISYSVGVALGILIFFNHLGKRKFSTDPTPIQVEVTKFKTDMDNALVEMASRKGHEEDVS